MKAVGIFFGILLAIALTILWYFSDNIKGYYTFKEYCEKEGGLRVYEPLEKNVGWWADDKNAARTASLLGSVDFVRYTDKDTEITYDLNYFGGDPQKESSFSVVVSDSKKPVVYQWKHVTKKVPNQLRLGIYGDEVINIKTQKTSVRYYSISYSKFDRSKTILDAPSTVTCFLIDEKEPPKFLSLESIKTAFSN